MKNTFAKRIYKLRIEKGYTQKQVATAINVLECTVSHWENGSRECDFDTLLLLSEFFGVSCDYLLGKIDY